MVTKDSVEEMFPQWLGEAEDLQLVNLITNIHVKKQIVSLTSEEEGRGNMGNNVAMMNIMSTLDNISRKFDHHECRFEAIESCLNTNYTNRDMSNMDQKTIDDIMKAAVAERLKALGVGKSAENYDNLSPQPNTQHKSVNSPMIDKTPGKGLGAKKNLAKELNKTTRVKNTLVEDFVSGAATPTSGGATPTKADGLDFVYISPAKAAKDAFGRGCRSKRKDEDVLLKKEVTAKKKAETALKKEKVAQIKKEGVARTGTPPCANVIRVKIKNPTEEDSSLVEVTDKIRARENELLPESDVEEEELIRSIRIKEYQERSIQLSTKGQWMTCMRNNFESSSAIYDPLALFDPAKLEKLMQHIKEIPLKSPAPPTKRPLQRSADFEGVDHLYGVLQVSGDHWMAFHMDLKKENIDFETKMVVAFKLITQMLPVMLNDIIRVNLRKPSKKQFALRRRKCKYISQNTQFGDCGCLALGVTFYGTNDKNIQGLRVKMATEIHDEGGNSEINNMLSA
ncbi:hypothetical protein N665_0383s0017 [Sinapis alba]|nr:hypothetical protein N665_0383s0017 [Sinapis alba]